MKSNFQLKQLAIEVDGTQLSLSQNHLLDLHYMEDITKSSTVIAVTITDTESAIISDLYGMEPIFLSWSTGTVEHTFNMVIYDIKDRMVLQGKKMKATLFCISPDAINNSATKISKRFGPGGGKLIHEIVSDLMNDHIQTSKSLDYTTSQTKFSFVSPYWDPFTIISWLSWRAIPTPIDTQDEQSAGYLFYETPQSYHFHAMDWLVQQESVKTVRVAYVADKSGIDDTEFIDVNSLTVTASSDIFRGMNLGSYNSTTMTIDLKDFSYREIPFNVNEYYNAMPKLNPASQLPKYYKLFKQETGSAQPTRIMSKVMDTALFTEGKYTQDMTRQLSQSMIRNQFFFNQSAQFEYVGEQDLEVGQVVDIEMWAGKSLEMDTTQSGRYIIGKIYRVYTTDEENLSTRVTLYRDSLG